MATTNYPFAKPKGNKGSTRTVVDKAARGTARQARVAAAKPARPSERVLGPHQRSGNKAAGYYDFTGGKPTKLTPPLGNLV